ncbi:MAG TPA: glycosyltransferase [Pyrinomonadaceae bacterium]|jgi:glycosyltransferase involved in cell wall biosynthesis|nr:glycosyltransferase [Pyrinomonadaceae bacterium]
MKPLAIVIPWFGAELKGGAEQQAFQFATRLAARGARVEVLTTCCRSFQDDWATNHLPPGVTEEHGITVRRFPVGARDREAFDQVNAKLLALAPGELRAGVSPVSAAEAEIFNTQNINSPALNEHLRAHGGVYRALIFIPYMFAPATEGLPLVARRSFLQPCLHDEPAAYFAAVENLFHRARCILFNSDGERELAARLYGGASVFPRSVVVGEGIERVAFDRQQLADALPAELRAGAPFVLYLGRRDETKNTDLLVRAYRRFKERATATPESPASQLKLVLAGAGANSYDERERGIIDLGLVGEETKAALLVACRALFQPSRNESFSRALMEAWSYGARPVAAHRECLATSIAVERADGGWLAATEDEWAETFARVAALPDDELAAVGARGRRYADEHADWDKVIARYEELLNEDLLNEDLLILNAQDAAAPPQTSTNSFAPQTPADSLAAQTSTRSFPAQAPTKIFAAVHQLLPDIAPGDAISNQALNIRDYLRSRGYASEIFVKRRDERRAHEASLFDPALVKSADALIYHHSIGSELTAFAVQHAGAKCLVYHNITPAEYYAPYRPGFAWMLETGRAHLPRLARHFDCAVGDSAFNAAELAACGFPSPGVLPIICDPAKWNMRADERVMERLQDGRVNLLFVGRIAPNKKQDELVRAFAHYRESDARSRLIIAGEGRASDPFYARLLRDIAARGLGEHVIVTGQITDAELLAYYRTAHLYWSLSEHEGFGVPLVEAMWFDVPVLAYKSTATPETLGDAGVTFDSKDDLRAAATLAKLLTRDDENLRGRTVAAGRVRREAFTPARVHLILDELLARMESLSARREEVA